MAKVNLEQIEHAVRLILEAIGDDPNREGVLDTPKRVAKCTQKCSQVCMKIRKSICIKYSEKIRRACTSKRYTILFDV